MTVAVTLNVAAKQRRRAGLPARTCSAWRPSASWGSSSAPGCTRNDGGVGGRGESSRTQLQSRGGLTSQKCCSRATRSSKAVLLASRTAFKKWGHSRTKLR